jgi:OHCU decarboxylase
VPEAPVESVPGPRVAISTANDMADDNFVDYFGGVLEASPHLAAAVAHGRPYEDVVALALAFADQVRALDSEAALALILAHPELGASRPMTAESTDEQASAGLTDAEVGLRTRLEAGNAEYAERFGFPFIIAVRGRTPDEIVAVLEERVGNDRDTELAAALDQICAIAGLRVDQLVGDS